MRTLTPRAGVALLFAPVRYFRPCPSGWVWVDGRSKDPLRIGPAGPGPQ
jgi:hypothetical protein